MVVKKALQMGLISEENYLPEFTKEATLAFLDEVGGVYFNVVKTKHQGYSKF